MILKKVIIILMTASLINLFVVQNIAFAQDAENYKVKVYKVKKEKQDPMEGWAKGFIILGTLAFAMYLLKPDRNINDQGLSLSDPKNSNAFGDIEFNVIFVQPNMGVQGYQSTLSRTGHNYNNIPSPMLEVTLARWK